MFKKIALPTVLNLGAQIVSMFAFLLLTKVINVSFVGEYLVFLSFATIISFFSTCFYEQSLYVEYGDKEGKIHHVLQFILLSSVTVYFILALFNVQNAVFIFIFSLGNAIKVLSRTVAVTNGEINKLAVCEFLFSPFIPFSIITYYFYFIPESSELMVLINSLVTLTIGFVYLYIFVDIKLSYFNMGRFFDGKKFLEFLHRYRKNLLMKLPAELINISNLRVPVIIIDAYISTQMAAFFGVSLRIVLTPVSVFSATISQIFISNVVTHPTNVLTILVKNLTFTVLIALGICFCAFFISDIVIITLLGEEYGYVAILVKAFIPYIFTLIAFVPFFTLLAVYEKQEHLLKSNIAILIATVFSYGIGVYIDDLRISVLIFSLSVFIIHSFVFIYIYKVSKKINEGR
ncbi:hypothetical protein AB6C98_01305 [Vibrio splendidus]